MQDFIAFFDNGHGMSYETLQDWAKVGTPAPDIGGELAETLRQRQFVTQHVFC